MQTYRAYLLNPAGKITWGEWIKARDLAEAEAKARELCDAGSPVVELWQGADMLGRLACDPDEAPVRRRRRA